MNTSSLQGKLKEATETGIELITTASLEQATDLRSQLRFREAVERERMMIYAAA